MNISVNEGHDMAEKPASSDSMGRVAGCQTNPSRWDGDQWPFFVKYLLNRGITVHEGRSDSSVFISDAGGLAHGMPHGVVRPFSSEDVAEVLKASSPAQN